MGIMVVLCLGIDRTTLHYVTICLDILELFLVFLAFSSLNMEVGYLSPQQVSDAAFK